MTRQAVSIQLKKLQDQFDIPTPQRVGAPITQSGFLGKGISGNSGAYPFQEMRT